MTEARPGPTDLPANHPAARLPHAKASIKGELLEASEQPGGHEARGTLKTNSAALKVKASRCCWTPPGPSGRGTEHQTSSPQNV